MALQARSFVEEGTDNRKNVAAIPVEELFDTSRSFTFSPFRREVNRIASSKLMTTAHNVADFIELFPSFGTVFEKQRAAILVLQNRGEQAATIWRNLRKFVPHQWAQLEECIKGISDEVRQAVKDGMEALMENNLSVIEQGRRKSEYEALAELLKPSKEQGWNGLQPGQTIFELIKDNTDPREWDDRPHPKLSFSEKQKWQHTIVRFLRKQYLLESTVNPPLHLTDHVNKVYNLHSGALYAYMAVLASAYPLPEMSGGGRAPNPAIWVEEWEKTFKKSPQARRVVRAIA